MPENGAKLKVEIPMIKAIDFTQIYEDILKNTILIKKLLTPPGYLILEILRAYQQLTRPNQK